MQPIQFRVSVPDEVLADLKQRLARTRWPDAIPGGGWDYGTDLSYLQTLAEYWRDAYDWRAQERGLNELQQFTWPIAGINLHFIHQPGIGPSPLPLLLPHRGPYRLRGVSSRDHPAAAEFGRACVAHRPLDAHGGGRTLPGARGTHGAGNRPARVPPTVSGLAWEQLVR